MSSGNLKTVNDVEPSLNQRDFVIPKLRNVKKKKEEPLTVKTELVTNAEFIASQISPPKVYYPHACKTFLRSRAIVSRGLLTQFEGPLSFPLDLLNAKVVRLYAKF